MNTLLHTDQEFFFIINHSLHNRVFDLIMPYLRDKNFWIPLYILLAVWLIYTYKLKSLIIIAALGLMVLLTDQIASSIIKPLVHRLRPCNDANISAQVRLLVDCGSGFSFVSSHAANHFGMAAFFIVLFGKKMKWIIPAFLIWATLICFAQIYVGLHYPFDIIGGALLGTLTGIITGRLCRRILTKSGVTIA